jgi:hypothetical protein
MGIPAPAGVSASGKPPERDQANAVVEGSFTAAGTSPPFAFLGPTNVSIWASVNTTLTTTTGSLSASVASGTGIAAGSSVESANVPAGTTWATFSGTSGTLALPSLTMRGNVETTVAKITGLVSTTGLVGAAVSGPGIPSSTTVSSVLQAADAANGVTGTVIISNTPTIATQANKPEPFVFALAAGAITSGADADAVFTGASTTFTGSVQLERSFDGCSTWVVCNVGGGGTLAVYAAGTPVSFVFGEPEREVYYRLNMTVLSSGTVNYRLSATGQAATSLAIATPV